MYGLDWNLLTGSMRFLCSPFPPSTLLHKRLRSLVQICCLVFACTISVPKINIFDHTTYPEIVTMIEQDLLFMFMSRFAPEWLLSSRRFTNQLHYNIDIEVPKKVIDTFSVGLKYISPIALKKSLVKESWNEFCERALKLWDKSPTDSQKEIQDRLWEETIEDPFFTIPIPFALLGEVKPYTGTPDERIVCILQKGQTELYSLLLNMPSLDRNNRSVDVESHG